MNKRIPNARMYDAMTSDNSILYDTIIGGNSRFDKKPISRLSPIGNAPSIDGYGFIVKTTVSDNSSQINSAQVIENLNDLQNQILELQKANQELILEKESYIAKIELLNKELSFTKDTFKQASEKWKELQEQFIFILNERKLILDRFSTIENKLSEMSKENIIVKNENLSDLFISSQSVGLKRNFVKLTVNVFTKFFIEGIKSSPFEESLKNSIIELLNSSSGEIIIKSIIGYAIPTSFDNESVIGEIGRECRIQGMEQFQKDIFEKLVVFVSPILQKSLHEVMLISNQTSENIVEELQITKKEEML